MVSGLRASAPVARFPFAAARRMGRLSPIDGPDRLLRSSAKEVRRAFGLSNDSSARGCPGHRGVDFGWLGGPQSASSGWSQGECAGGGRGGFPAATSVSPTALCPETTPPPRVEGLSPQLPTPSAPGVRGDVLPAPPVQRPTTRPAGRSDGTAAWLITTSPVPRTTRRCISTTTDPASSVCPAPPVLRTTTRSRTPRVRGAEPEGGPGRAEETQRGGREAPGPAREGRGGDPALGGARSPPWTPASRSPQPRLRGPIPSDQPTELEPAPGASGRRRCGNRSRIRPSQPTRTNRYSSRCFRVAMRPVRESSAPDRQSRPASPFTPPGRSTAARGSPPRAGPRRSGPAGRTR